LQVEVVPEAVAEDEGVGLGGLGFAEEGLEAVEFFGGDGEADHCFDLREECEYLYSDIKLRELGWEGLTHHVNCVRLACQAARVVFDNVAGLEDALDGARFDVELIVAEALFPSRYRAFSPQFEIWTTVRTMPPYEHLPLFRREVPIRYGSISQVLAYQYADAPDDVPHHTISNDDDFLESAQDLTDLFRREPPHITAPGHVRSIMSDAPSRRQSRK